MSDLQAKAAELSESREWFSKTLLSIGDGVVVVDPAETVEFLNPIAEKLTGWTLSEAKGRTMQEVFAVINEKTRDPAHNLVKLALAQEEPSPLLPPESMLLISKDGQEHPIEESAAPIMGKGGELLGVILVFRDISERKKSASRLAETERRFQTVANAAPVLIWTADTQKQYDWFNEGWLSFTGRTLEDQVGTGWIDEVHPEDVANRMSIYFSAFEARKPFEMQYRLRRHDGEYRIVLDRGSPRFSPDGDFVGYIGSCSDITQAEVARKKLEDLTVDLEKALRSRDEFLSIASHELKTPLTSLRLQLQITQRKINVAENLAPSPQKLKQVVDLCLDQSSRITNLIEELLDVSRIQEGKLSFNFEEVDLVKLVQDQVDQLSEQFRQAGCEVSLEATPVTVVCDRFRMDQVVTNLLTNAIKYGAQAPVKIRVSRHGGEAWLQVEDHGVGIPKEHQQNIFNRFERVEESRNISGLGLGLYIAKQIVTAHKGSIDVVSEQGRGSIFTVKLKVHATLRSFTMRDEELSS